MSKINDEKLKKIPISFSKLNEYENKKEDIRFTEVLIKILHLGRNYNGSVFTQKAVEDALPSLANTPILGFIESNEKGEEDFSDHRTSWNKDKDGNIKVRYEGNAYGVIPESFAKEAYFEDCVCSDGITRTYLFCKALLWNKFDYVLDIFDNNEGVSKQSMELAEEYTGHWTDDGFEFDSFLFDGCCAISVQPAMIDSTIELSNFSANDIANEIANKLNKYELLFSSNIGDKEEGEKVARKKKEEKQEFSQEEVVEVEAVETEMSNEEVETEVVETEMSDEETVVEEAVEEVATENSIEENVEEVVETEMADKDETEDEETEEEAEEEKDEENKKSYRKFEFSLSHEDIRCKIYDKLFEMEQIENTWFYIIKTQDNYFVYQDEKTGKFYKQDYVSTDNEIAFEGERIEVFNIFVDGETQKEIQAVTYSELKEQLNSTKEQLDVANGKIVKFEKENAELLEFKANADEEARKLEIDKIISKFSKMSELDLELYKTKAYNKEFASNEELENALYIELGKLNYSKNAVESEEGNGLQTHFSVAIPKDNVDESIPDYGAFNHIFRK